MLKADRLPDFDGLRTKLEYVGKNALYGQSSARIGVFTQRGVGKLLYGWSIMSLFSYSLDEVQCVSPLLVCLHFAIEGRACKTPKANGDASAEPTRICTGVYVCMWVGGVVGGWVGIVMSGA